MIIAQMRTLSKLALHFDGRQPEPTYELNMFMVRIDQQLELR